MGMKISDLTDNATIVPSQTYIEIEQMDLTAGVRSRRSLLTSALAFLAGTGWTSETVKGNADDIADLAGVGRTTETVKDNADDIADLAGAGRTTETVKDNADNISSLSTTVANILNTVYPVGCYYTQYPNASSNTDSTEFPTAQRPATLFGGTWAEQWSTESIFFRTRGTLSDSGRTNGKQEDAFQDFSGTFVADGSGQAVSGVFEMSETTGSGRAGTTGTYRTITIDPSNSARTATETRTVNRRIKVWKRTA